MKYKSQKAVKMVAAQLIDMATRVAAAKDLKAVGPDAEDAVLRQLDSKDIWVRAEGVGDPRGNRDEEVPFRTGKVSPRI